MLLTDVATVMVACTLVVRAWRQRGPGIAGLPGASAEAGLPALFESANVGIFITRPDGAFVSVNSAYARLLGYADSADFLEAVANARELYAEPAERKAFSRRIEHEGFLPGVEIRLRRRDGAHLWVRSSVVAIRDAAGRIVALHGTGYDVTETRKGREQAQLEQLRQRKLFELLPVGVWLTDERNTVAWANEAARRIVGDSINRGNERYLEYKGRRVEDGSVVAMDDWPLARAVQRGQTTLGDEMEFESAHGEPKVVRFSAAPLNDDGGKLIGAVCVGEDITPLKRQQEEKRRVDRMYAALSRANEAILRAGSQQEVFERACEIAVEAGDFMLGTVLLVGEDGSSLVRAAASGPAVALVAGAVPSIHEADPRGRGLVGLAWRTGKAVISDDYRNDPRTAAKRALDPGWPVGSAAVLPLRAERFLAGAFVLQHRDPGAFGEALTALLQRLVDNVSFAMENFRREARRMQAQQALLASEARFRSLTHLSSDSYWEQDAQYRFTSISGTLPERFHARPHPQLGKSRWELDYFNMSDADWAAHRADLDARRPFRDLELGRLGAHGMKLWLSVSGEPVSDGLGMFTGYRGVAKDITERKHTQETLQRFRAAMDHSADLILLADRATMRIIDANATACRLLGYTRDELLSMGPHDLLPVPREALERVYDDFIVNAGGAVSGMTSFYRCKDGSTLPFESTRRILRSEEGWIIVAISRDIRERLAAERKLRESEEERYRHDRYFRSLIETASDIIAVLDQEWRIAYISSASKISLGYAPDELVGKTFPVTASAEETTRVRERLSCLTAQPGVTDVVRFRGLTKAGEWRTQEVTAVRGIGPSGEPIYVLSGRDITERIQAEEALQRREREFRALAENSPDVIVRYAADMKCSYMNGVIFSITGRPPDSFVGKTVWEQEIPLDFAHLWDRSLREVLWSGESLTVEAAYPSLRGLRHYETRFVPESIHGGPVDAVLVISRDITERKRNELQIAESEARLRGIIEATAEPILLVDDSGDIRFANPAAAELLGRDARTLIGTPLGLPLADKQPAEVEVFRPDGEVRSAEMRCAPADLHGSPVLVVSLHDMSERKRYEQQIAHLANHDSLTGLPNRALLRDRVEQAISQARRALGHVALIFVDLDRFKLVNDSWGHPMGDALLLEIAARLNATVRDGDTVARLGGDEFAILLPYVKRPEDAARVAEKITEAIGRPLSFDGRDLHVTASVGISLYPNDGDDLDQLLQHADVAMYRVKEMGRNGYQFYSADMGQQARERVETESALRQALARDELQLYYQPQVDLRTGEISGFEALLRWARPGHGMVPPVKFISVAEESGLIVPIGEWALRTACKDAASWKAAGLGCRKIAVNLSARQFWQGSVTQAVKAALEESGVPPEQLELEITESVVVRDLHEVVRTLEELRALGVTVAIDDFGTGYSSLAYLRTLPIDKVKIDKSFIPEDLSGPPGAFVAEIIRLAHILELEVVAEGIETAGQARFLREAGCERMQGYLFSRPVPAKECESMLREGKRLQ